MTLRAISSQTVGPFFHIGLRQLNMPNLVVPGIEGKRITIQGRVLDADSRPVSDAIIEIWQANAYGKYDHPEDVQDKPLQRGFKGFGRITTKDDGTFCLSTIKPGRVPGPGGILQAPHIVVLVFMRGLLKHYMTRIYFPNEPSNIEDPILRLVEPERRSTLVATNVPGYEDVLEWNIVCAGVNETVFFEY